MKFLKCKGSIKALPFMAGFLPRSHPGPTGTAGAGGDTEFFYRFSPNPVRFLFRISVAPRLSGFFLLS
jgi:hypothetical protein